MFSLACNRPPFGKFQLLCSTYCYTNKSEIQNKMLLITLISIQLFESESTVLIFSCKIINHCSKFFKDNSYLIQIEIIQQSLLRIFPVVFLKKTQIQVFGILGFSITI